MESTRKASPIEIDLDDDGAPFEDTDDFFGGEVTRFDGVRIYAYGSSVMVEYAGA